MLVKKEVVEGSAGVASLKELTSTGTCVLIEGALKRTPEGTKQVRQAWTCSLECAAAAALPCLCGTAP